MMGWMLYMFSFVKAKRSHNMVKLAIVYHSGFGHTKRQAEYVLRGAKSVQGVEARLFNVPEAIDNIFELDDYDGIIFGSPTYMGSVSAEFKTFMDATSVQWSKGTWKDKLAAGFTNAVSLSGDKLNTLVQMAIFAAQHGMIWVPLGEFDESVESNEVTGDPLKINRMGSFLGAMAQSDNKPAEEAPEAGDLQTAYLLGVRVAKSCLRWGDKW